MGILDSIKDIYKKADAALGGILPGDNEPAKTVQNVAPSPPSGNATPTVTTQSSLNDYFPGSVTNTYDPGTNTYTDASGNKQSIASAPKGATIVNPVSSINNVTPSASKSSTKTTQPTQLTQPTQVLPTLTTSSPTTPVSGNVREPTKSILYDATKDTTTPTLRTVDSLISESQQSPLQKFAFSKVGNEPTYGTNSLGTPLHTTEQVSLSNQCFKIIDEKKSVYKVGEQIINGDFSFANDIPSAQGIEGKSVTEYKAELAEIREWALTHAPTLSGADPFDLGRGAVAGAATGLTGGVIAGGIGGAAAGGIGAVPGAILGGVGGAVVGAVGYLAYYNKPTSTKEARKDLREGVNTIKTILPILYEEGLTEEADLLYAEMQETIAVFETLGEYATERDIVELDNYAQAIQEQFRELESVALKMKQDSADRIEDIEYRISTNQDILPEELDLAAKNGSVKAQNKIALNNVTELSEIKLQKQNELIDSMVSMSYEQMRNNPNVLNSLDNPVIAKIYSDAQKDALEADERKYEEYLNKREFDEAKQVRDEQRAYTEAQQAKADIEAAFTEATATESSGGSNLTFGLLNSSGDIEFVDRDRASQAYFGKLYEELTPAQKRLLMLSKGQIQG